jgi:hypothetical protein
LISNQKDRRKNSMSQPLLSEEVKKEWEGVITAEGVAPIKDATVRNNTIRLLENTKKAMLEEGTTTGNAAGFDPVLISMVRRTMPSLIANDIVGVQPMSGPTGLIFAMKAHYTGDATTGAEAFGVGAPNDAFAAKQTTAQGEALGDGQQVTETAVAGTVTPVAQSNPWKEMSFAIEKVSVTAQTRALKAKYTQELAQDLKAIHGLDAEAELANILTGEVTAEINREIIGLVRSQAVAAPETNWGGLTANTYRTVTDSDARWEVENYKALYMNIVREANRIAQNTRRGVGNILIVSPNVAAALEAATKLDVAAIDGSLQNDFIGATYAGVLGGRFKMYVDPYQTVDFVNVGYKGANNIDAGIFYCPYVPLQMMKAQGEEDFQPRMGMKTRYGLAINPFVGATVAAGTGANEYYRDFLVSFD